MDLLLAQHQNHGSNNFINRVTQVCREQGLAVLEASDFSSFSRASNTLFSKQSIVVGISGEIDASPGGLYSKAVERILGLEIPIIIIAQAAHTPTCRHLKGSLKTVKSQELIKFINGHKALKFR